MTDPLVEPAHFKGGLALRVELADAQSLDRAVLERDATAEALRQDIDAEALERSPRLVLGATLGSVCVRMMRGVAP